jgi:hypothetical protein
VILGLLVLVRTFLSWALVVEIEGHWPWGTHSEVEELHARSREGGSVGGSS